MTTGAVSNSTAMRPWTGGAGRKFYTEDTYEESLTRFRKLPIFVEESAVWYNTRPCCLDGLWGNADEISGRHGGNGYILFIDGVVELFENKFSADLDQQDPTAYTANDLYVRAPGGRRGVYRYRRLYETNRDHYAYRYGWINSIKY